MASKGLVASSLLMIGARTIIKTLGLISSIILARLLTPADFGLVAICMLVIYFFDLFSTLGTKTYILSLPEITEEDINSAWTLDFLVKSIIAFFVLLTSGYIAEFFDQPSLTTPIAICALIPLIAGFENPKLNILRRNLEYKIIFRIDVIAKIFSFIVTVSLAYILKNYWALIYGSVVSTILITSLGYILCPYKPKFCSSKFKEQWSFSKWVFLKGFVGYGRAKTDTFILGKFFSLSHLGLFNIAKEFALLTYEQIALPVCEIVVSGIRELGVESKELPHTVELYLAIFVSVILPATVGISFLSNEIILTLLGEQWREAGELLKVLSFLGFCAAVTAILVAVLSALRKVKLLFSLEMFLAVVFISILFMSRNLGIYEFTMVVSSIGLITLLIYYIAVCYYIKISTKRVIVGLIPALMSSACMLFVLQALKDIYIEPLYIDLFIIIFCGAAVYSVAFYLLLAVTLKVSRTSQLLKAKVDSIIFTRQSNE